ncbi:hypothetical protein DM860_001753 [Cuscuta australis]|uniref:Protein COFACTOR ASSEMBLY OF COMPLEX C SUBUNIT B CCB1, chloroplastic n=1 Tax=Cuscuta australis TaxID=267555 RepID=A0A328E988_9ASTE|nr:hypothetical protein DM860_001753 [Cuscuta australis]
MATKLLLSPLFSPPGTHRPWRLGPPATAGTRTNKSLTLVGASPFNSIDYEALQHLSAAAPHQIADHFRLQNSLLLLAAATDGGGYSLASYYTSLGLFVISVPGLWSLIKRSVKSKIARKTFVTAADEAEKKAARRVAGEIQAFFARNNFVVLDRGETITFEGMMSPSRGQAALLSFCTCVSLASVSLVLTIALPDVGNRWFWLVALSPLAGVYYWTGATRKEQVKVRMMVDGNGTVSEVVLQGDDVVVEQLRKELNFSEKGMVYVKRLFG